MMPEILDVKVPEVFIRKAPSSYTGFQNHVSVVKNDRQWTEEKEKWKKAKEKKQGATDISSAE